MKNKTTLREIINNIDRTKPSYVNWVALASEFDIYDSIWYDDKDTKLKAYYFQKWYCTDTYVGSKAYFFNDELVAISYQSARRADEEFTFVNKTKADEVEVYLRSLIKNESGDNKQYFDEDTLENELDSIFKIEYSSQILHKEAFLNGKKVKITKTYNDYKHFHEVEIEVDGEKKEVDCRTLDFEYNAS